MEPSNLLDGGEWVTDGGLETDLLFNHGVDLPEFASFPLIETEEGSTLLKTYYGEYAAIAAAAGVGLIVETPTWRANPDWGAILGYDATSLDRANRAAVALAHGVADSSAVSRTRVSGVVGPRGDGYVAAGADADEAADYHSAQVHSFAAEGVDLVHAMTMTEPAEAKGVVRAARAASLPVAISFTVETDGRLPDGSTLADAVAALEATDPADWYGVNCAHPTHVVAGLDGAEWQHKLAFFRPNASTMSHEELDAMEVLDSGDLGLLVESTTSMRQQTPALAVIGGCCGTDSRHVAALWGVPAAR
ncbi:homocysteine S-methyltransferase family protein [Aeromicrobium ginsengisoli]|uniref:Homocysteine S-methyltransferase n=1 Tax=Aeromicrobium ginsengisoli TaxID=363867 RepID=A0A5M4FIL2_9ACTN|nr:homocysteine S-methyltransferase family protein [Aeromicrobium ginsengisoli]KAA1399798.1 homocysteine S-methyltransferase [Aeromicrobium ginsengisoli]